MSKTEGCENCRRTERQLAEAIYLLGRLAIVEKERKLATESSAGAEITRARLLSEAMTWLKEGEKGS